MDVHTGHFSMKYSFNLMLTIVRLFLKCCTFAAASVQVYLYLFLCRKVNKTGGVEFKQDLMKSQTLPRANGAQAKRALFERMNSEPTK